MKIHLGCGTQRLGSDWLHVDARQMAGIDVVSTAHELPEKVGIGVARLIYWSHGIEHVRWAERMSTLEALVCTLKRGGVLRLAVPDMVAIFEAVIKHGVTLDRVQGKLYGHQDYPDNYHHCGWDFETLYVFMRDAGLTNIRPWYPIDEHPYGYWDYSFDKIETRFGTVETSLNLEGTKP